MYILYFVCIFHFLCAFVYTTEGTDCKKQCPSGEIPAFCTRTGSNSDECVNDNRHGMEHGHWDVDYKEGKRCILRCDPDFVPSGCHVQRKWIDKMPTCIKDDLYRKAKDWGKTGLKVTAIGGVAGAAVVAATPVVIGFIGFTSNGVAAGSIAAAVQSSSTAAGSIFAWAQSVGAVGYVGGTGSAVIGGGTGTVTGVASTYLMSSFTGCEAE
ncbi:uncharacterized protein LOC132732893 [Ruditapes philippinarum]|uniref:uncharacterized protein LOC132732893 n=1 Tax=Ruditapes philippinarum TaxID=129788 RepID=UPI00295BA5BE|nr:uncharacterized protein LOC132732893 [Ruditapes philippinarum]